MRAALKSVVVKPGQEFAELRAQMASLLRRVPRVRRLLDVGCGDGRATSLYGALWGLGNGALEGVEIQEKYLALPAFRVHTFDLEKERFPFEDQSYDLVICNQVLEHLKMVIAPLRELARITQTGGHLALGIPNLSALVSRLYLLAGRDPISLSFPGPHIRGLTHRSFLKFLRSNPNFSVIAVTGAFFYPVPPPLSGWLATVFPGLSCYTLYLLKKLRHDPSSDWSASQFPDESVTG